MSLIGIGSGQPHFDAAVGGVGKGSDHSTADGAAAPGAVAIPWGACVVFDAGIDTIIDNSRGAESGGQHQEEQYGGH